MNNIEEVLYSKGLKQKWLAEKLGMSTVIVNQYVKNKRQPKHSTMVRISLILQVDIQEICKKSK